MDMLAFSKARSLVERALSVSSAQIRAGDWVTKITRTFSGMNSAFEIQRISALIYVNLVLRNGSLKEGLLSSLKLQLVKVFETAEANDPNLQYRRKFSLWCFVMGGIVSVSEAEEHWFAERIVQTMRNMGISDWSEVEEALIELVWVDTLRTSAWKLWQRVQAIQG